MVLLRLYRWRRRSGQPPRIAFIRAWKKWREPDPFHHKKETKHGHQQEARRTGR